MSTLTDALEAAQARFGTGSSVTLTLTRPKADGPVTVVAMARRSIPTGSGAETVATECGENARAVIDALCAALRQS